MLPYQTVLDRWAQLPSGYDWVEVVGVATDSRNRVYIFNRGRHPVLICEEDGTCVGHWGEGLFQRAHGIHMDANDKLWLTDDLGHSVRRYSLDGQLEFTLGPCGVASETGCKGNDYRTIERPGPPYNQPTNLAIGPDGTFYVTDGYGNARVHRFSSDGELLTSWGEPGDGPGQFHLPHGIGVDAEGLVYVADRENSRIQIFSPEGRFVTEWRDVVRPTEVFLDRTGRVFVSELGWKAGVFPGTVRPDERIGGRLSIFNRKGGLEARWGGAGDPAAAGNFYAPHDIWVDGAGAIYVSEVVASARRGGDPVADDCRSLQKFIV